jgi:hypothetical protein
MKDMKEIVSFSATPNRRAPFASMTLITEEDGQKSVTKKALLPEGNEHIEKLASSYSLLNSLDVFSQDFNIIPVTIKDSGAMFPHIEGESADSILMSHLLAGGSQQAELIINKIADLINNLPTQNTNPTSNSMYCEIFGEHYNYETECIVPGIIDLNLDNFIIDKTGKWNAIDYEWVFDFPVPKDYILRRYVVWFFTTRLGNSTSLRLFKDTNFLEIGKGVFVPEYWANKYSHLFSDPEDFIKTEYSFQSYVNIKSSKFWHSTPRQITKEQVKNLLNEKAPSKRFEELEAAYLKLEETYIATRDQLDKLAAELNNRPN